MELLEKLNILSSKIERLIDDRENLKNENEALRKRASELEAEISALIEERKTVREKVENLLARIG
ncbi:MAG: cell division protein ZapB [Deferribacterales bacterium]